MGLLWGLPQLQRRPSAGHRSAVVLPRGSVCGRGCRPQKVRHLEFSPTPESNSILYPHGEKRVRDVPFACLGVGRVGTFHRGRKNHT